MKTKKRNNKRKTLKHNGIHKKSLVKKMRMRKQMLTRKVKKGGGTTMSRTGGFDSYDIFILSILRNNYKNVDAIIRKNPSYVNEVVDFITRPNLHNIISEVYPQLLNTLNASPLYISLMLDVDLLKPTKEISKLLIERGADVNILVCKRDEVNIEECTTPFDIIFNTIGNENNVHVDVVEIMLKKILEGGKQKRPTIQKLNKALKKYIIDVNFSTFSNTIIRDLVRLGADVSTKNMNENPLKLLVDYMVKNGKTDDHIKSEIVIHLIINGADINIVLNSVFPNEKKDKIKDIIYNIKWNRRKNLMKVLNESKYIGPKANISEEDFTKSSNKTLSNPDLLKEIVKFV